MTLLQSCAFRAALVSLVSLGGTALAQSNRGAITGTVVDSSGAIITNARVAAKETHTATTYNTITSQAGDYSFPQLLVGVYDLTFSAPGFKTEQRTGIVVQINTTAALNVQLTLGATSETVTVTADNPTVQSATSEISGVVTPQQVEQLPLSLGGVGAFRSPEAFEFLLPGVVGPGTGNNANGIYIQKTSGGQNFGDDVVLDGNSASRPDNGSTFDETAPSVDSLQEFKVTTATPPAQYGRTTGGIRSFTSYSGTNSFHGQLYDIFRNTVLDANTYFNDLNLNTCTDPQCRSTFATPKDIKNDYGVTLGGPVIVPHFYNGKDRTFFFFAWEQVQWPRSSVTTSSLPTAAERAGDFSAILGNTVIGNNPCNGQPVLAGEIFDPRSQTVSAGGTPCRTTPLSSNGRLNVIPASLLDPVAVRVLSYLPSPTTSGLQNNFSYRASFPTNNTTYTVRIDHSIGSADKIFAAYDTRQNTLLTGGLPTLPTPLDPGTWIQNFVTHYGRFGWDHTLSPSMLNHVSLGFSRWNSANNSQAATAGVNWAGQIGLSNVSGLAFPQFNLNSGFPSLGQQRADDTISNEASVADNLTWVKGKHTFTIGGEYRWMQLNNLTQDSQSGVFNFSNAETAAGPGVLANQGGFSFASFLLGQVDNASLTAFAHYPRYTQKYWALYLQDDLKVNSHLTLNLGLRWDVDQPRTEASNFTSNFDPTLPNPGAGGRLGAVTFASNCNGCNPRWAKTFYDDFAPRIGFAWSPGNSGKLAIRGGYGIIYGPLYYADFGNSVNAGYAASPNPSSSNGFTPAFTLGGGFPAYPAAPTLNPAIRNNSGVDYISPGFGKPPMIQSWSLQIQQQLAPDLILSLAYVGNKSQNLRSAAGDGMYNNLRPQNLALGANVINAQVGSSTANAAGVFSPYPGFNGPVGQALRPYPQYFRINTDCCLENDGMSTFNALEAMLQRRFHSGLNLQLSYTWSKTITNADSFQPCCNAGGGLYQDPFNLKLEKAISSQDIPQMFVASFIYELPFGKNKAFLNRGGFANAIFGGWQIGAILRYQSGQPLPFYCAANSFSAGWDNCFRFNPVAGQSVYSSAMNQPGFNPLNQPYLNNAYFADPNPNPNAPIVFGQLSRVTGFRMANYDEEDVNLVKRFNIREAVNLELRADAFNIANRHVFAEPYNLGPQPNNPTNFGFVNGTVDAPRLVQLEMRLRF